MRRLLSLLTLFGFLSACADHDIIIRGGTLYNGSGSPPFIADVAIDNGVIAVIGSLTEARGRTEIDASGLAVAPGFINMLPEIVHQ